MKPMKPFDFDFDVMVSDKVVGKLLCSGITSEGRFFDFLDTEGNVVISKVPYANIFAKLTEVVGVSENFYLR